MTRRVEGGDSSSQSYRAGEKTGNLNGRAVTTNIPSTIKGPPSPNMAYKPGRINAKPLNQSSGLSGIIQRIIKFISSLFGSRQKTPPKSELLSEILNLKLILKDAPGRTLKEKMDNLEKKDPNIQEIKKDLTKKCTQMLEDSMKGKGIHELNFIWNALDPEIQAFVDRDNLRL